MNARSPRDREPAVRLEALSKRFPLRRSWRETLLRPGGADFRTALDGLDLSIGEGEFFALGTRRRLASSARSLRPAR